MIKIKYQKAIIEKIKKGISEGIYKDTKWCYVVTSEGKHLLWYGKSISNITKKLEG